MDGIIHSDCRVILVRGPWKRNISYFVDKKKKKKKRKELDYIGLNLEVNKTLLEFTYTLTSEKKVEKKTYRWNSQVICRVEKLCKWLKSKEKSQKSC